VPPAAVPTHGLRFSITLNALLPLSRSSLAFLAIYQLTTLAAPLTRALFELPTANSPKLSASTHIPTLAHWSAIGWFWPRSRPSEWARSRALLKRS